MKNQIKSHFGGFTLIELLVVVLIIGILSAIALPQYQKAVVKSRYGSMKVLVRALADAEQVYYLANGKYTMNFDDLDISLPPHRNESNASNDEGNVTRVTRYFSWGTCYLSSSGAATCNNSQMRYSIRFSKREESCWANNLDLSSVENQICKAETGRTVPSSSSTEHNYTTWAY